MLLAVIRSSASKRLRSALTAHGLVVMNCSTVGLTCSTIQLWSQRTTTSGEKVRPEATRAAHFLLPQTLGPAAQTISPALAA